MRRPIVSTVLAASLLTVLSVALAFAGSTTTFNVTVPFAFTVGGMSFPSGDYSISETSGNGLVQIQSRQDRLSTVVLTYPGGSSGRYGIVSLLFHRYGDRNFLWQVSAGLGNDSRELPVSRQEREIIGSARLVANNFQQPEVIVVGTR